MIDLVTFKQLLGPDADALSEKEIKHIRDLEDGFADVIFEMWLRDRYTQSIQQNAKT